MEDKVNVGNSINRNSPTSSGAANNTTRKPQPKTHTKFLSQSAPNTSFIKNQNMENKLLMGGDDDINSNPGMNPVKQDEPESQVQAIPQWKSPGQPNVPPTPDAIKRTENSLGVSVDVENLAQSGAGSIIIGVDQDRSNRIDVLWRVPEGRAPDTEASVSDCVMCPEQKIIQFQQTRSRFIPQFQKKKPQKTWGVDELGQSSQTGMSDPNEIEILVKKSEDDHGDRARNGGDMFNMQPNEPERKIRREPLTWPWHTGSYRMNFRFHTPEFRTLFSSKILITKALQWLLATVWTYVAFNLTFFRGHQHGLAWTFYVAVFFLFTTFLTVRSTSFVGNQTSIIVLLIYTLCVAHISAMLHIYYECPVIPIVLITMTATYILSAATFTCVEIDADSNVVYYPIFMYVITTSIVAFWIVLAIGDVIIQNPLGKMITVWFPSCLMALIVCSLEMLEIQALIRGTRTPLEPNDWVLATTFLL